MRAPRPRLALVLLLVALMVLVVAPAAIAGKIVPGVSIDHVRIGQSKAAVKHVLGPPPHIARGRKGSGVVRWDYTKHNHLTVVFVHDKVTSVFVLMIPGRGRVLDHTSKGIGLGSKMSAVAKAYPGHCEAPGAGYPPVCSWQAYWTTRMLFSASGRYGTGWKAPVETIKLSLITIASRKAILARLREAHDLGALTDEEYAVRKADVLATM